MHRLSFAKQGWFLPIIVKKCHFLTYNRVEQLSKTKASTLKSSEKNRTLYFKPTVVKVKVTLISKGQHTDVSFCLFFCFVLIRTSFLLLLYAGALLSFILVQTKKHQLVNFKLSSHNYSCRHTYLFSDASHKTLPCKCKQPCPDTCS